MLQLKNETPFVPGISVFANEQGVDTLYIALKATFTLAPRLEIAPEQLPLCLMDEYWGESGQSSLKYAYEIHPAKPGTDIVLQGEACAPEYRPVRQLDVALTVADRRKVARVYGDRVWEKDGLGLSMTPPQPFERMPLIYENAYGGCHVVDPEQETRLCEERNPVGKGFVGKRSRDEIAGMALPNLEDPARLIASPRDQPGPAGFGYIAPDWLPRRNFAGTYDENWQKTRAPYLPEDFDSRFLQAAAPDLQLGGYLTGGEPVEVINVSPRGPLRFHVPICAFNGAVRIAGRIERPEFKLETLLIEPAEDRLAVLWRAQLPCDKESLEIEQVNLALDSLRWGL